MSPHGNRCPLGQSSHYEDLLSQQTRVCCEVQPGLCSTVTAAGEHHLLELVPSGSLLPLARLPLRCLQHGVLGPGAASVQGLQLTQWVAVHTPQACWCVTRVRLATSTVPSSDDESQLPSAIVQLA